MVVIYASSKFVSLPPLLVPIFVLSPELTASHDPVAFLSYPNSLSHAHIPQFDIDIFSCSFFDDTFSIPQFQFFQSSTSNPISRTLNVCRNYSRSATPCQFPLMCRFPMLKFRKLQSKELKRDSNRSHLVYRVRRLLVERLVERFEVEEYDQCELKDREGKEVERTIGDDSSERENGGGSDAEVEERFKRRCGVVE